MAAKSGADAQEDPGRSGREQAAEQRLHQLRAEVNRRREQRDPGALAQCLEDYASAALGLAAISSAAEALAEAADLWRSLGQSDRAGSALLLATSSHRLAGSMPAAAALVRQGLAADFPAALHQGFEMEAAEQCLARGEAQEARRRFSRLIEQAAPSWPARTRAQVFERRAAAAHADGDGRAAAADLLHASQLYSRAGLSEDGEAAALAAAALLAGVDPSLADQVVQEVMASPPAHGAVAARRGLVGGHVAASRGNWKEALARLDQARQGALDCRDPVTYLLASVQASEAAEKDNDLETAYGRLATAWSTLSDLLGRDMAAEQVRPCLQALRLRWGQETFQTAKTKYEATRRRELLDGQAVEG